ncbi:MAG TPA: TIGR01777 family oxidoreductase [Terriglobia bacterium]|nr:TIGR01777 family oxidoreductase [Terriglobia bacterium]
MRVLITGASGLVGSSLILALNSGGHRVVRLVRSGMKAADAIPWNPAAAEIDSASLEGFDAVVHLAGENIAGARWTAEQKQKIRDSRVGPTRVLCESLARLHQPPRVLASASAIGYYGNRGDEWLDEESAPGAGFLPDVCREWEDATGPAAANGIRVIHFRIGLVLSRRGGALAKMLPPFRMGLGGVLGSGRQYMSWIRIDDLVGAIQHCLTSDGLSGPVLAVAPHPVTNREFTKTLGRVLSRPTLFPVPAFVLRMAFGELADALLLASARATPGRLLASGYRFLFPELEPALRHVLGK